MAHQTKIFRIEVGDPERVSIRLAFFPDPHPAPTGEDEVDTTWGEFALWANGVHVTGNRVWGDENEGIQWYLLPLLEWLTENWDPLLHEERPAALTEVDDAASAVLGRRMPRALSHEEAAGWFERKQEWLLRHDLSVAGEGGRFPTVLIRRLRGELELSWSNDEDSSEFGFDERHGAVVVNGEEFAHLLYEVLSAATTELLRREPDCHRYRRLAATVDGLRKPEHIDERLAWLAGLGQTKTEVLARWHVLAKAALEATASASAPARKALFGRTGSSDPLYVGGSCRVGLLFGSLAPTITDSDARLVARQLVESFEKRRPGLLEELGSAQPGPGQPWEQGYEAADHIHHALGTNTDEPIPIGTILTALGVTVRNATLSDANARAFCFVSSEHRPTIVVNKSYWTNKFSNVRRTTLAHELCHLILDRDQARELAIASGPWAPLVLEQRANAFAAMFLMPEALVLRAVAAATQPPTSLAGVRQIAFKMKTSTHSTIEHLQNLNQIDMVVRDRLLEELSRN